MEINALEYEILNKLLAGDNPILEILRAQLSRAVVSRREMTDIGFVTTLSIAKDAPAVTPPSFFELNDVTLEIDGVEEGAGATLFVSNGYLDDLECYTWEDEHWPEQVRVRSIRYVAETQTGGATDQLTPTDHRDAAALRRQLGDSFTY